MILAVAGSIGVAITFCACWVLKLTACALQQKGFGEGLGQYDSIRTAVIKDGYLYIQAGGGIVHDSVPRLEWKESLNKGRAIFRAAAMAENRMVHPELGKVGDNQ